VSGDPISSTKFNTLVQDLEADANTDRPIVAGGTGASTALAARANLGLEIGVNVQAYDAGLLSIAGLTTLADRSIYTTASDTYAVYTLTAAGRAILDDADAAAQRTTLGLGNGATTTFSAFALTLADDADAAASRTTLGLGTIATQDANNVAITGGSVAGITDLAVADGGTGASDAGTARTNLGLGTAATVNTGTSGATIPLLNAGNVFSGDITISKAVPLLDLVGTSTNIPVVSLRNASRYDDIRNTTSGLEIRVDTSGTPKSLLFSSAGALSVGGNTVWHAGNDGAGSGLDADTLDGIQASAFALLATDNTFARNLTFSGYRNIALPTGNAFGRIQGRYDTTGGFHDHLITGVNWLRNASGSSGAVDTASNGTAEIEMVATNGASGVIRLRTGAANTAPTDRVVIDNNGLQARTAASSETTGTLTVASANTTIQATGDITIPNAVFAAGDIILIYAGASSRTITEGASVTMRLGGSSTTGSRTLAARGVAVLFFVSSSEVAVSGGAVT
jgi:hypothetical protein